MSANSGSLRIALTADPELPVPPVLYGGIERIVDFLARGLVDRGHDVTLFANEMSHSAGRLVPWPGASSTAPWHTFRNSLELARRVAVGKFDVVHSFSRIAYMLPLLPLPIPKLMTYQRPISRRSVKLGNDLSSGSLWFSAISEWMMRGVSDIGTWRMVFNGVQLSSYTFRSGVSSDAPLMFLGRIEEIKGPHLAIEIAKRNALPLVIAGNIAEEHRGWVDANVLSHVDGKQIRFVGPVDDAQKNALLSNARALLMPILWDEPFGIVMAEAMACGTPVVGYNRGAVPEVVADRITGFVADTFDELSTAVTRLADIDRKQCRDRVEKLFSSDAIVEAYLSIYREMIARRGARFSPEK